MTDLRTWDAWNKIHQPFELEWWKKALSDGHSNDPEFTIFWDEVKEFIGPVGDIVDIGCGARPPFASSTIIDPLADKYKEFAPPEWWQGITVHAQPAEQLVPFLEGDTIICWNCIDHTIGWRDILDNMLIYGRKDARFAIATDFWPPFDGHPGFERDIFMAEIADRFNIHKVRNKHPAWRALSMLMTAR